MIDPASLNTATTAKTALKAGAGHAWDNVPNSQLNCVDSNGTPIPDDVARTTLNAKASILPGTELGDQIAAGTKPLYVSKGLVRV